MATGKKADAAATFDGRAATSSLSRQGVLLLVALTVAWGVNWPIMKIVLLELPPWTFRSLCLMAGGGLLLALTALARQPVGLARRHILPMAVVSVFNITGWHIFSAYGLLQIGSGRAAIIAYTMPLWTSLLSLWVLRTGPNRREVFALVLGMGALVLLIGDDLRVLGGAPTGALLMTAAAVSWAMGTVLVKKIDWQGFPVLALTGWQQILGGLPVVAGWAILEPLPDLAALSPQALMSLAYVLLIAMVFCHAAFFKLLSLMPAHATAIAMLAVPGIGVLSGAIMLNEAIGAPEVTALMLVIAALVLARPRPAQVVRP